MPDQAELRRRIRAAMALGDVTSWESLAEKTPFSRSTLKDLGTKRGDVGEHHLRSIAAACHVDYAFFTVPSISDAVADAEEGTLAERVEALEEQVRVLLRRLGNAEPPHPSGEIVPPPGASPTTGDTDPRDENDRGQDDQRDSGR